MKRDEILQERDRLAQALGHPPTLEEVAHAAGCSRESARLVYVSEGIERNERARWRKAERESRTTAWLSMRATVAERNVKMAADLRAGANYATAVQAHGVGNTIAAKVRIASGLPPRRRLFSPEEDAIVLREVPRIAAALTGRDLAVIYQRRARLRDRAQNV
jgi:hypothetical protein